MYTFIVLLKIDYLIVQIREEALQKELQALRLALLRKRTCSTCSSGQMNNGNTSNVADDTVSLIFKKVHAPFTFPRPIRIYVIVTIPSTHL